jgi:hypothetical protein
VIWLPRLDAPVAVQVNTMWVWNWIGQVAVVMEMVEEMVLMDDIRRRRCMQVKLVAVL